MGIPHRSPCGGSGAWTQGCEPRNLPYVGRTPRKASEDHLGMREEDPSSKERWPDVNQGWERSAGWKPNPISTLQAEAYHDNRP